MKLTHELLSKHMNIPITCLYMWWLDTLNLGDSYVWNLSLTSYEPNLDICSAIGLTTRLYWNFGYVMSKLRFLGLICYTHAIFNVYLESHACYEGLFTLLSYAMYVPNLYTRLCFCIELYFKHVTGWWWWNERGSTMPRYTL